MANKFLGTWHLETSENFDEYMKAVEVSFMMRKLGSLAKPNVTISLNGNTWSIKGVTTFSTSEAVFQLGEEFEETTADGRKVMSTFVLGEDGKLVQTQTGKVPSTITRELTDDNTLVCTCIAKDVTSKRIYKRVIG
jgi:hypothetical protein